VIRTVLPVKSDMRNHPFAQTTAAGRSWVAFETVKRCHMPPHKGETETVTLSSSAPQLTVEREPRLRQPTR